MRHHRHSNSFNQITRNILCEVNSTFLSIFRQGHDIFLTTKFQIFGDKPFQHSIHSTQRKHDIGKRNYTKWHNFNKLHFQWGFFFIYFSISFFFFFLLLVQRHSLMLERCYIERIEISIWMVVVASFISPHSLKFFHSLSLSLYFSFFLSSFLSFGLGKMFMSKFNWTKDKALYMKRTMYSILVISNWIYSMHLQMNLSQIKEKHLLNLFESMRYRDIFLSKN